MIILSNDFNYEFTTVWKLGNWAEALSDDTDFLDYWYNLFLSETKYKIEKNIVNKINAFHWTRWQEDFEEFVDGYIPQNGTGFASDVRGWFAKYMQYLVFAFQIPGKEIASFYSKDIFGKILLRRRLP